MPHFGAVLEWEQFHRIFEAMRNAAVEFELQPTIRYPGKPGEQITMFVYDPSGNALEFKAFRGDDEMFRAD